METGLKKHEHGDSLQPYSSFSFTVTCGEELQHIHVGWHVQVAAPESELDVVYRNK